MSLFHEGEMMQPELQQWEKYFPKAPLPIGFYYTDHEDQAKVMQPYRGGHCLIKELQRVRQGESLSFENKAVMCGGGKYYLGFTDHLRPNFTYFLSCGIAGQLAGERYKASPELVEEQMSSQTHLSAPARKIVFKRWDKLAEEDQPLVVIFFVNVDVAAGLFTLANFDAHGNQAVFAPAVSGCSSIVQSPMQELQSDQPRVILGMFDVSARPWVPAGELSLAVPWPKFTRMVDNMDESFLITQAWETLRRRLVDSGDL
jgi:uncharacterized protein (DUF169 family)